MGSLAGAVQSGANEQEEASRVRWLVPMLTVSVGKAIAGLEEGDREETIGAGMTMVMDVVACKPPLTTTRLVA